MKKVLVASAVLTSCVFANISDTELTDFYKDMVKNPKISISVEKRSKIKNSNLEQFIVKFSDGIKNHEEIIFSDGKYLFPEVIDPKNKKFFAAEYVQAQEKLAQKAGYKKLANLIKSLPKDKKISLGNDAQKETVYLFTDPLCPYCKEAMKQIEGALKNKNLIIIFAPIPQHGEEAFAKSAMILKEVKSAKNDEQKIAILKKWFSNEAAFPKEISKDEIKNASDLADKVYATGVIRGVPSFIDSKDLQGL